MASVHLQLGLVLFFWLVASTYGVDPQFCSQRLAELHQSLVRERGLATQRGEQTCGVVCAVNAAALAARALGRPLSEAPSRLVDRHVEELGRQGVDARNVGLTPEQFVRLLTAVFEREGHQVDLSGLSSVREVPGVISRPEGLLGNIELNHLTAPSSARSFRFLGLSGFVNGQPWRHLVILRGIEAQGENTYRMVLIDPRFPEREVVVTAHRIVVLTPSGTRWEGLRLEANPRDFPGLERLTITTLLYLSLRER